MENASTAPRLPTPKLAIISPHLKLLKPLSRVGKGPGLILVTSGVLSENGASNSHGEVAVDSSLEVINGVPSPLLKWAEEGYTVVEITEKALSQDHVVETALDALRDCPECQPEEKIGIVVYDQSLWNPVVASFAKYPEIVGAVCYTDASAADLAPAPIPTLYHVAGKAKDLAWPSGLLTVHSYPSAKSATFATPFQPQFQYSNEAVSHTRSLSFLKRLMNGPTFDLEAIWDEHTYYEFENRSVDHTMATMVQEPYVNHIPTMTGGIGRDKLSHFYRNHFIYSNPADTELELISRTVGVDRVVDEFIYKFTHDVVVDWLIPGIPPTNRRLEIPFTAIVNIRGDRLYHEHIAWDQANVLVQLGLLPEYLPFVHPMPDGREPSPGKRFEFQVPAAGIDAANKARDKAAVPSNTMFAYAIREQDI